MLDTLVLKTLASMGRCMALVSPAALTGERRQLVRATAVGKRIDRSNIEEDRHQGATVMPEEAPARQIYPALAGRLFVGQRTIHGHFLAAPALVLMAALLACNTPVWRAAHIQPVEALRSE